jgi:hypothetical protein
MLVPLLKREVLLLKSSRPTMFNLILDGMNGFSAKIDSIVPLGRGYFTDDPRHFVPGYDRAVPPGQIHSTAEALLKLALMGFNPGKHSI